MQDQKQRERDLKVRRADVKDAEKIQDLLQQLGYSNSNERITNAIRNSSETAELFVAVSNEKVIAFMSLIYFYYFPSDCNVCRITGITVDESTRGSGVGSQLIEFALEKAQLNNCAQLEITTSLAREKTQKYYEHLGFKKASFRYYRVVEEN